VTASDNRSTNILGILSLWETEDDRVASDNAFEKARDEAVKVVVAISQWRTSSKWWRRW
jgi:hypothetical protein